MPLYSSTSLANVTTPSKVDTFSEDENRYDVSFVAQQVWWGEMELELGPFVGVKAVRTRNEEGKTWLEWQIWSGEEMKSSRPVVKIPAHFIWRFLRSKIEDMRRHPTIFVFQLCQEGFQHLKKEIPDINRAVKEHHASRGKPFPELLIVVLDPGLMIFKKNKMVQSRVWWDSGITDFHKTFEDFWLEHQLAHQLRYPDPRFAHNPMEEIDAEDLVHLTKRYGLRNFDTKQGDIMHLTNRKFLPRKEGKKRKVHHMTAKKMKQQEEEERKKMQVQEGDEEKVVQKEQEMTTMEESRESVGGHSKEETDSKPEEEEKETKEPEEDNPEEEKKDEEPNEDPMELEKFKTNEELLMTQKTLVEPDIEEKKCPEVDEKKSEDPELEEKEDDISEGSSGITLAPLEHEEDIEKATDDQEGPSTSQFKVPSGPAPKKKEESDDEDNFDEDDDRDMSADGLIVYPENLDDFFQHFRDKKKKKNRLLKELEDRVVKEKVPKKKKKVEEEEVNEMDDVAKEVDLDLDEMAEDDEMDTGGDFRDSPIDWSQPSTSNAHRPSTSYNQPSTSGSYMPSTSYDQPSTSGLPPAGRPQRNRHEPRHVYEPTFVRKTNKRR